MTHRREIFKPRRTNYEERARGLKSYITGLTDVAARHGRSDHRDGIELGKDLKDARVEGGD